MLTKEEVQHIASLARIQFDDAELERLPGEFGTILDFIGKLQEVKTEGVETTAQATGLENVYRKDALPEEEHRVCEPESLLCQAPSREEEQIKVKAVFE